MPTFMRPVDAAWLHMDRPTNPMVITSVLWLDKTPDWDEVTDLLHGRVVEEYPRFTQRVSDHRIGVPRWEDDPLFDIALHVHRVALPSPGGHDELQTFVGDVMSRDLDRRHPLWQAWLVDGYEGGAAIVVRVHHCIADGVSLAQVLLSLTEDAEPQPRPQLTTTDRRGGMLRTLVHSAVDVARDVVSAPSHLLDAVATGIGVVEALAHDALLPADTATALRGPQSGRKVAAWSRGMPLDTIRDAAHAHDATVNDVLLAALSGALRRCLEDMGSPAEEIRALVPVNLRPLDRPVPRELGNDFGLVFCPLPVGVANPLGRLRAVQRTMGTIKATPEAVTSIGLLAGMGLTPSSLEDVLVQFFADKASLVATNVPGPRHPVTLAGVPVSGVLSWAPQSGPISTSATIFSYAGSVVVGIATDPALIPDPQQIVEAVEEEVALLSAT